MSQNSNTGFSHQDHRTPEHNYGGAAASALNNAASQNRPTPASYQAYSDGAQQQIPYCQSPQMSMSQSTQFDRKAQPPKKERGKKPKSFWVAIVIALIAIVVIILLMLTMCQGNGLGQRDRNSEEGQLEGKTAEQVQAELDRIVEEGMFNISIASRVEFPDGTSPGEIKIENVPNNRYLMQVVITRDDTGETIYTSGIIEPNHHIQQAPLDVDLPAGAYECTATFYALDPETEEQIGQAAARMTVIVDA